jgi:hypothetical protein
MPQWPSASLNHSVFSFTLKYSVIYPNQSAVNKQKVKEQQKEEKKEEKDRITMSQRANDVS